MQYLLSIILLIPLALNAMENNENSIMIAQPIDQKFRYTYEIITTLSYLCKESNKPAINSIYSRFIRTDNNEIRHSNGRLTSQTYWQKLLFNILDINLTSSIDAGSTVSITDINHDTVTLAYSLTDHIHKKRDTVTINMGEKYSAYFYAPSETQITLEIATSRYHIPALMH